MTTKQQGQSEWDDISAEFGDRLRQLRVSRDMTQEELAEASGLSRNQIQNLEAARKNRGRVEQTAANKGNPTLETMWALSRALDIEVTYLVERKR